MQHDDQAPLIQGVARRLVPIRWPHSQKLAGYYDLDTHELVYQDARGRVVEAVDLGQYRSKELTKQR